MESLHDIIYLRRRELLGLWAIFLLWCVSQFLFRFTHGEPYSYQAALEYVAGFTRYMLGPWALLIVISFCGYILGRSIIRLVVRGIEFRTDLEETIWSIGTGLGLISILTFLLGLIRMLYPFTFILIGILILAYGYKHIAHFGRILKAGLEPLQWNFLDLVLLLIIVVLFLNSFLLSGNPSTGWDAMNSHLCAPKFYLRDHAVSFYPWINFNNFPQVQEMLLTLQMMAFPDPGTSLVCFFMILSFVATYLIGGRYFGRTTGLLAVLFLYLGEEIFRSSQIAFVEHLLIFYILLLVQAFLAWYESGDRRWLILAGIAGGIACGVKYTGTESVLLVFVLMIAARFLPLREWEREDLPATSKLVEPEPGPVSDEEGDGQRKKKRKSVRRRSKTRKARNSVNSNAVADESDRETNQDTGESAGSVPAREMKPVDTAGAIGLVFLWTVIVAAPWYIQNLVLFGNPFFPFFESIFGGLGLGTLNDMRDQLVVDRTEMLQYFNFNPTPMNVLMLPWNFTFHHNHPSMWRPNPGTVGPFFLAFVPVLLFIKKWRRAGLLMLIYLVLFLSYWFLVERLEHQRYVMSSYPFICLLIAWGITRIFNLKYFSINNRAHLAWTMLLTVVAFGFFYRTTIPATGTTTYFLEETREEFLKKNLDGYPMIKFLNDEIEAGAEYFSKDMIVYGLGAENRRYYCDFPLIGGLFGYANHFEFMEHASTGRELFEYLDGMGCNFLIFSEITAERMAYAVEIRLPDDETFDEHFEKLAWTDDFFLYHLLSPGEERLTTTEEIPEESAEDPDPE